VVEGVVRIAEPPPDPQTSHDQTPYRIYNIGNNQPVELAKLIHILEEKIGKRAKVKWLPMQPGDVPVTYAAIDELSRAIGYHPHTTIEDGVSRFVDWYREYYKL